jgi:peptidoglycan-N-acetylglucosamine deacetylase
VPCTLYLYSMHYLVKTPWIIKKIFPSYVWDIKTSEKIIYLTFDDGPHPVATPFVLDQLKQYNAKATFFCVGKNVIEHPNVYKRVLTEGHATGNHTQHHINGFKTASNIYESEVNEAARHIDSRLFRPPYGRIKNAQSRKIRQTFDIIMWTILSGDFDKAISNEQCLSNVINHTRPGSIIVFHDSEKAFTRLEYALPKVLEFFSREGYRFEKITTGK